MKKIESVAETAKRLGVKLADPGKRRNWKGDRIGSTVHAPNCPCGFCKAGWTK